MSVQIVFDAPVGTTPEILENWVEAQDIITIEVFVLRHDDTIVIIPMYPGQIDNDTEDKIKTSLTNFNN